MLMSLNLCKDPCSEFEIRIWHLMAPVFSCMPFDMIKLLTHSILQVLPICFILTHMHFKKILNRSPNIVSMIEPLKRKAHIVDIVPTFNFFKPFFALIFSGFLSFEYSLLYSGVAFLLLIL